MKTLSFPFGKTFLRPLGRGFDDEEKKAYMFTFSASGFEVRFLGSRLSADFVADCCGQKDGRAYLAIVVDGGSFAGAKAVGLDKEKAPYLLCGGLPYGVHRVRVYKRTEASCSFTGLQSLTTDGSFRSISPQKRLKIEFYGDSITAGNGSEGLPGDDVYETRTENPLIGYAGLVSEALDADFSIVAIGGFALYRSPWNAQERIKDIPTMFDMADFRWGMGPLEKVGWDNSSFLPDIVVINLGTNDDQLIRSESDPSKRETLKKGFKAAFKKFLDRVFAAYGDPLVIAGTGMIANEVVDSLIEEACLSYPRPVSFIRFDSLKAGGYMANGGHPNAKMHEEAARELLSLIKSLMATKNRRKPAYPCSTQPFCGPAHR
ncbi:MAG: GDSL-type esterase/lipase family protein [Bacilli bacterium]|jgi:lysophospholipase L1-like esterase|nr:GDSL-type esterase/lipase family protein [Bacilli bacterium]